MVRGACAKGLYRRDRHLGPFNYRSNEFLHTNFASLIQQMQAWERKRLSAFLCPSQTVLSVEAAGDPARPVDVQKEENVAAVRPPRFL